jgi:hypothetical protein
LRARKKIFSSLLVLLVLLSAAASGNAQKRKKPKQSKPAPAESASDLARLRDEYIKTTGEYKESLQKLLVLYQDGVNRAQERVTQTHKLLADGLVSRREVEQSEQVLREAQLKVSGVQQQIAGADTQIAQTLLEVESEKQIARLGRMPKGALIQTTSFIRYNGAGAWMLSQAGKIETFFQQTFGHPLPIAVFGQGAIHNQWRLDHRNAMDISLHPDGAEGQALINFLRNNGIPFSAFRGAIPGVATGPHIHIGRPSHRY